MTLPVLDMGPCWFCGHPDSGHRVRDALLDRFEAGESEEELATDYGLTPEQVMALIEIARRENCEG